MKLKAILQGNEIVLPVSAVLKKPKIEVEIEISDEDIMVYSEEELKKLSFDELVKLVWKNAKYDVGISKDYKELLSEALEEKYK